MTRCANPSPSERLRSDAAVAFMDTVAFNQHAGYFDAHGYHHTIFNRDRSYRRTRRAGAIVFVALSVVILVVFGLRLEHEEQHKLASTAAAAPSAYGAKTTADARLAIKVVSSTNFASLVSQAKASEVRYSHAHSHCHRIRRRYL